jgi:hypothetical protein
MAGDWIKWSKGLAARREVVLLASLLQRDRHEIAGRLMVLWEWLDDNVADSEIDEVSLDASLFVGDKPFTFLDALVGLPGFADALASDGVRWLSARSGGRLTFPHFGRHNGTTAKTRALESRKKQRQRASKKESSRETSRQERDIIGTREEKRREEYISPSSSSPISGVPPPSQADSKATTTRTGDFASQEPRRGGASAEADWRNCEITLRQLGVAEAAPACQAARENGASPGDVLAVVEHFTKAKAWKLGALAWRVKACAPGLKPQDGWPPREASARAAAKPETDEQRVERENFDAMQIVRAGRRAKKTDDEIEREIRAKGLGAAGARLGWRLERVES